MDIYVSVFNTDTIHDRHFCMNYLELQKDLCRKLITLNSLDFNKFQKAMQDTTENEWRMSIGGYLYFYFGIFAFAFSTPRRNLRGRP